MLLPGLDLYIKGFNELSCDRIPTMGGLGPIPWTSIVNWCRFHGICDINNIDAVVRYFRAMEKAEYEHDQKKEKRKK